MSAVTAAILDAIDSVPGLRLAAPVADIPRWWRADARGAAVDVTAARVEVRVVATALPLPPLLERAAAAVRAALAETEWSRAPVRLIVTELDASAFRSEESAAVAAGSTAPLPTAVDTADHAAQADVEVDLTAPVDDSEYGGRAEDARERPEPRKDVT